MASAFRKDFNRPPRDGRGGDKPRRNWSDRPPRKWDGEDHASERSVRDFGDRPPKREWSDRPPRRREGEWSDRPPRRREGDFDDRPAPSQSSRGFGKMGSDSARPARDFGDRPPPKREWSDRPPRKPRDFADSGSSSGRPRSDYGSPRPPRRREGEWSDRPPRRSEGEWSDRPPRKRDGEGLTPSRPAHDFWDRSAKEDHVPVRDSGDRPPRKWDGEGRSSERPYMLRREKEEVNPNEGLPVLRRRLVVFGGSFDPVHKAHIELARRILDQDYGDEVMFIPAKQSPLKVPGQGATAQARLEMLNLAIEDALAEKPKFTLVKKPPRWAPEGTPDEVTEHDYLFSCSDLELQRPGENSYTYDTLCTIQKAFPEKRIIFLMGTDKLEEIPRWYRYAELIQQFDFLIYRRPGYVASPFFLLAKQFGDVIGAKINNALLPDDLEKFPQMDLSSTEVRNALANGEDVSQSLSPSVLQYIKDHQLYQPGQEAGSE